eukprot:GDKI01039997.1.p1 GENE.GDKI01039997.1~~GDKI01039997.1.p1  ORF type:complete len:316 (-),score=60.68 GDKI01039997.1:17-964(-)
MRILLSILPLLCCVLLCKHVNGDISDALGFVRFYSEHTHTLVPEMKGFYIAHTKKSKETTIGFDYETILGHIFAEESTQFDAMIKEFPTYNTSETVEENKQKLQAHFLQTNALTKYEVLVANNTYNEQVYTRIAYTSYDKKLTGQEAKEYLTNEIYSKPDMHPLMFAFEAVHRLASPAYALSSILEQIHNENYTYYTREWAKEDDGFPAFDKDANPIYMREYGFDVRNDNARRYTPTALAKLFTPLPAHTDNTQKYTHVQGLLVPIKSAVVNVYEVPLARNKKPSNFTLRHIRLYNTRTHPDSQNENDLVIAFQV